MHADSRSTTADSASPSSARLKVSRRTVLSTAAAAGAAGLLAHSLWPDPVHGVEPHATDGHGPNIWSVAFAGGEYLALTGLIGHSLAVRQLAVGSDWSVTVGAVRPIDFPAEFTPTTICGFGKRILFAGSVRYEVGRIVVDNRIESVPEADRPLIKAHDEPDAIYEVPIVAERPAIFEAVGSRMRELPLGKAAEVPWGVASTIAATDGVLAVSIESSSQQNVALAESVSVAVSTDGGGSWATSVVATGLGEGFPTALAVTREWIAAVTVAGDGSRMLHRSVVGSGEWRSSALSGERGSVLAAVPGPSGSLDVFDGGEHGDHGEHSPIRVTRVQLSDGIAAVPSAVRQAGEDAHDVLPVNGAGGQFVVIGNHSANLVR
jgi:hypothetical protein